MTFDISLPPLNQINRQQIVSKLQDCFQLNATTTISEIFFLCLFFEIHPCVQVISFSNLAPYQNHFHLLILLNFLMTVSASCNCSSSIGFPPSPPTSSGNVLLVYALKYLDTPHRLKEETSIYWMQIILKANGKNRQLNYTCICYAWSGSVNSPMALNGCFMMTSQEKEKEAWEQQWVTKNKTVM